MLKLSGHVLSGCSVFVDIDVTAPPCPTGHAAKSSQKQNVIDRWLARGCSTEDLHPSLRQRHAEGMTTSSTRNRHRLLSKQTPKRSTYEREQCGWK